MGTRYNPKYLRIFSLYVIALLIWGLLSSLYFMEEYRWAYEESLQARLVLLKLLYSLALASFSALAVWPTLIERRLYRLMLAYSLSVWATASVGPEVLLLVYQGF